MPYKELEKQKEWVKRNSEHLKEYKKEWSRKKKEEDPESFNADACRRAKISYEKDPEKFRARTAAYREVYPEKVKEATAQWFAENKEYRKKYKAKYRKTHRKEISAYQKANRERQLVYKANRKTRETRAGGSFTLHEWRELCAKYKHKCLCCGKKIPLTVDHVIPVSKGGTSYIGNIQPLCGPCNYSKHANVVDYRKVNNEFPNNQCPTGDGLHISTNYL